MMKIIPKEIPSRVAWDNIIDEFGNVDLMFIACGNKDRIILNSNSLKQIWDITKQLENRLTISEVISISNSTRIDNIDNFMEVNALQEKRILNNQEIEDITKYLNNNSHIENRLLSHTKDFANIIIRPSVNTNYAILINEVMEILKEYNNDLEIYYSGIPYTTGLAPTLIQKDVSSLMKIGMIIMVIILLINLRNFYAVFLVMVVIFLSLLSMMGFMGWIVYFTGSPKFYFTLLNSSMPIILLTIANSDGVHVVTKFFKELSDSPFFVKVTPLRLGI